MKIILAFLFGIIIGFMYFQILNGNSIPDELIDKYTVKEAPFDGCKPYIKIIEPKSIVLDSTSYLQTIKALSSDIADLKASNNCYRDKCSGFAPPGCD